MERATPSTTFWTCAICVLEITPASTNPKFTERGLTNVFRVCGRDDQQGAVAGGFIAKSLLVIGGYFVGMIAVWAQLIPQL